ncbi:MAG: sporulation initiation factor Spo0A C-terminal domain-containing protein [Oscillospiraceae bacterium]|nr:sporulation initiation factor Spo0A C-terminal domain-containing protein [Oscillospiraceae bacterium]
MENNDLLAAVAAYVVADGHEQELAKSKVKRILNGISSAPPERKRESVEAAIRRVLVELGVPSHVKGYSRLICAIRTLVDDPAVAEAITKGLYPAVAKEFGDTPTRVERTIRHAVELSFERGSFEAINRYFGNTISSNKGKPTNSEFITRLADVVRDGL